MEKIPVFLNENIVKKVFTSEASSKACIAELQEGFKKVGIYQVSYCICVFTPVFLFVCFNMEEIFTILMMIGVVLDLPMTH